jgi:hypothetical protein
MIVTAVDAVAVEVVVTETAKAVHAIAAVSGAMTATMMTDTVLVAVGEIVVLPVVAIMAVTDRHASAVDSEVLTDVTDAIAANPDRNAIFNSILADVLIIC